MNQEASISVTIRRGINAVQPPPSDETDSWRADHVIFNHPHIGTEDAALHARFISHFLHTCFNYWMRRDCGILHLTLVKGQYERWKCEESAQRHDLILLERNSFVPPPGGGHYHHRRHQTGKSFASRAIGGSETFSFRRKTDHDKYKYVATCLPWQTHPFVEEEFPCPFCGKIFREERSRTSHLIALHPSDSEMKRERNELFQCQSCTRTFANEQALTDHVRAKHTSLHSAIQPDWVRNNCPSREVRTDNTSNLNIMQGASENASYGSCNVCGVIFKTKGRESKHLKEFVPIASSVVDWERVTKEADAIMEYRCSFCNKRFRDKRAQLQHENFCTSGRSTGHDKDN
jgi:uncharacterized C2H2 Zn-finger protein